MTNALDTLPAADRPTPDPIDTDRLDVLVAEIADHMRGNLGKTCHVAGENSNRSFAVPRTRGERMHEAMHAVLSLRRSGQHVVGYGVLFRPN